MQKPLKTQELKHRVIAFMSRDEMEFINRLAMDAMFTTGHKLTHTEIISAVLEAMIALKISGEDINSKEDLTRRILQVAGASLDRRQYPRLNTNLSVGIRPADSLAEHQNSMTLNASLGGFKLELADLEYAYQEGQLVEVTFPGDPPLKVLGRISWIKVRPSASRHELGVNLVYVNEHDIEKMKSLLREAKLRDLTKGDRNEQVS